MSPRHVRAQAGIDAPTAALRLGIATRDLLDLERTPLAMWETGDLRRYLAALGWSLRILAVSPAGTETDLT